MATAQDVAAYILEIAAPMTAMKLQKLVYYCQAWHLTLGEQTPLFNDRIEAWAAGPVVPALYQLHRRSYWLKTGDLGGNPASLSEDEQNFIDIIINHYRGWTAEQLSEQTHKEAPWLDARRGLNPAERGDREIDVFSMAEFYGGLAEAHRANQSRG